MEVIDLPLLFQHMTLRDSVETMRQVQLAGVVVRREPLAYSLLRAVEIYATLANGSSHENVRLRDVSKGFSIHEISHSDVNQWNLNLADPYQTRSNFEYLLDKVNTKYGLLDSSSKPGFVRIVTRHEDLARQMGSAPKVCYCDNDDFMHPYPPPPKSHGDTCYCGHRISCYK
jgi:hypothetical protein